MHITKMMVPSQASVNHAANVHDDSKPEKDGCQLEIRIRRATSHGSLSLGFGLGLRQSFVVD
jgi:hypothetical protein